MSGGPSERISDQRSAMWTLFVDACAVSAHRALDEAGVPSILIKGASFTDLLPDAPPRTYADVDLLVPPASIDRAVEVLAVKGYRDVESGLAAIERGTHAVVMGIESRPEIDLHRTVKGCGVDAASVWATLSTRAVPLELAGGTVAQLDVAGRLLVLVLNVAHSAHDDQRVALDLARALTMRADEEWAEACDLAIAVDAAAMFAAGLARHPKGAELSSRLAVHGRPPGPHQRLRAGAAPRAAQDIARLAEARTLRARVTIAARVLLPTPAAMRMFDPSARGGTRALVSAYARRPVRLVRRLPGALATYRDTAATSAPLDVPVMTGMGWFPDQPGGLNRYLRDLHTELSRRSSGVVPALVVGPVGDACPGLEVVADRGQSLPARVLAMNSAVRRHRPSMLDVHFAPYALVTALWRRPERMVVHFQGPWAAESEHAYGRHRALPGLRRAVERAVYRRADAAITLSDAFSAELATRYGVPGWRIHKVRPGVDLDGFRPGDRRAARRRLGLAEDAWIVVCARRLDPRMGIDVLIDAWSRRGSDSPSTLVIAGDGDERAALEAQARRLGATSVVFLGRVSDDDLVALYQGADVSVVPTRALEGFGLVVIESLACGTPVIATNVGGLPETLLEFDPSCVVPPESASALALRLDEAQSGLRPLRSREDCREYAERFTWERAVDRHLEIYDAERPGGRLRVAVIDHCARLSGGELALARTLPVLPGVDSHVILFERGPLEVLLADAGIENEVVALTPRTGDLRRDSLTVRRLPIAAVVDTIRQVWRIRRRLVDLQPDLVYVNSLKAFVIGGLAARTARLKVVWHVRDRVAEDYLPSPAVLAIRALARWVPAAIVANSTSTLSTVRGLARIEVVVPSPIEPAVPRCAGDGGDVVRLAVVGRLAPWKGQLELVRALSQCSAVTTGRIRARIVGAATFGEDEYESAVRAEIALLGLGDIVEMCGFRSDVAEILATTDVLVHCSTIAEPFGQVVAQGMAAGCTVIVPDAGGPAELVRDGIDGVHYRLGDVEALAATIDRVVADESLRRHTSANAPAAVTHLTPLAIAGQIRGVFDGVAVGMA